MYEFCYDYVRPKYNEKIKLSYMDTDSFMVHVEIEDIYQDNSKDIKKRFDTSTCELKRQEGKKQRRLWNN